MLIRGQAITLAALIALAALAWLYLLAGAGMNPMAGMDGMAAAPAWPLVAVMWTVMMVAMMVPAAASTILLYGQVHRRSSIADKPPPTAAFLAGYLLCWTLFALVAATLQLALQRLALASPAMTLIGGEARAGVLIAAGLYQLSPFKNACLGRCRSPAQFLNRFYRPGASGALRLGLIHGAFCIGCCWLLMGLLFVGGVMNLAWIAGLTVLVAAEKLVPKGEWIARIAGVLMIAWGGFLLAA